MIAPTLDRTVITEPGVYEMDAEVYHADPVAAGSLSSSGARKLLPPSCPALFKYEQDNPRPARRVFEIGHAAHAEALGTGPELVRIEGTGVDPEAWRTNDDKAAVQAAHDRGAVPLRPSEYQQIKDMAAALQAHPEASALFNPYNGTAEQSLFWHDESTGVWRRARLDWLPNPTKRRMIVPDYKTCRSAHPDDLQKAINEHGYFMQAAWYLDGVRALDLADDRAMFVFVFQEKTPPYLVTVAECDTSAMRIGATRNRVALMTYAECVATGRWPGYTDDIVRIPLPAWAEYRYLEDQ